MAQVIPYALMAVSAIGTIASANAQEAGGRNEYAMAQVQADELKKEAMADRATSQRAAQEERRKAMVMASRARAVAAASGADALDPTVVNLISNIDATGDYNARSALFEGETAARDKETRARAGIFQGRIAKEAAKSASRATLIKGATGLAGMYYANQSADIANGNSNADIGYTYGSSSAPTRKWWEE